MVGFNITRGQELELRLSRDSMAESLQRLALLFGLYILTENMRFHTNNPILYFNLPTYELMLL